MFNKRKPIIPTDRIEGLSQRPSGPLAVCIGDSLTQGQISSDWVRSVARGVPEISWVNAGINGNLSWNILQRLDPIVSLQPDFILLLIGSNDMLASMSPKQEQLLRKQQRIPRSVHTTLEGYAENLDRILTRLRESTTAKIAVIEMPPAGEDICAEPNEKVQRHINVLRSIAAKHNVSVLPLFDRLIALLPSDRPPRQFSPTIGLMIRSGLRHSILKQPWDRISAANKLAIHIDHLHLNDTAASNITSLVTDFVREHPASTNT